MVSTLFVAVGCATVDPLFVAVDAIFCVQVPVYTHDLCVSSKTSAARHRLIAIRNGPEKMLGSSVPVAAVQGDVGKSLLPYQIRYIGVWFKYAVGTTYTGSPLRWVLAVVAVPSGRFTVSVFVPPPEVTNNISPPVDPDAPMPTKIQSPLTKAAPAVTDIVLDPELACADSVVFALFLRTSFWRM
jgi:hypothetical protein